MYERQWLVGNSPMAAHISQNAKQLMPVEAQQLQLYCRHERKRTSWSLCWRFCLSRCWGILKVA